MTTATRKATHTGTCQICGRTQKLPNGRLSVHGYTTRWGFFEGICFGSDALPFEQSIDLIVGAIARAKEAAAGLRRQAAAERTNANGANVPINAYFFTNTRVGTGYRWIRSPLVTDADGHLAYQHPGDAKPARLKKIGYYGTRTQIVAQLADAYAMHLERQAAQRDEYVAWQEGRIADWSPAPLKPIVAL